MHPDSTALCCSARPRWLPCLRSDESSSPAGCVLGFGLMQWSHCSCSSLLLCLQVTAEMSCSTVHMCEVPHYGHPDLECCVQVLKRLLFC